MSVETTLPFEICLKLRQAVGEWKKENNGKDHWLERKALIVNNILDQKVICIKESSFCLSFPFPKVPYQHFLFD